MCLHINWKAHAACNLNIITCGCWYRPVAYPAVGQCVSLSVRRVNCGKMADRIRMPFGVASGVGRGMSVLDKGGDRRRGRSNLGQNVGHPIVTNGDFVA